jgi:hypothetical protein
MRWPGFLLLPLLLIACTDTQPVAPIEDGPVLNFMNNPKDGPHIYRYGENWGFWFENVDGHLIVIGLDAADLCGDWSGVEFSSVFTPTADGGDPWFVGQWIDNWQMKDAPASIYAYSGEFDCVTLQALGALATGKGHANGNDNDFSAWNPDADVGNNNANAFGWNVYAKMGGYNFNAHWRCVWKLGVEYPDNCTYNQRLN